MSISPLLKVHYLLVSMLFFISSSLIKWRSYRSSKSLDLFRLSSRFSSFSRLKHSSSCTLKSLQLPTHLPQGLSSWHWTKSFTTSPHLGWGLKSGGCIPLKLLYVKLLALVCGVSSPLVQGYKNYTLLEEWAFRMNAAWRIADFLSSHLKSACHSCKNGYNGGGRIPIAVRPPDKRWFLP